MFGSESERLLNRWFIDRMAAEIEWLRSELRYEKARADRALDQMTSYQIGRPVVTALPAQPAEDQTQKEIAALMRDQEFTGAGEMV